MIQLLTFGAGGGDTPAHTSKVSQRNPCPWLVIEEPSQNSPKASWFGWLLFSLDSGGLTSFLPQEDTLFLPSGVITAWESPCMGKCRTESPELVKAYQQQRQESKGQMFREVLGQVSKEWGPQPPLSLISPWKCQLANPWPTLRATMQDVVCMGPATLLIPQYLSIACLKEDVESWPCSFGGCFVAFIGS